MNYTTTTTSPLSPILSTFETISKYYMALLIALGTFGNLFCILAYTTADLKRFSSTRYLIALSMSDLGFVLCMSLTWLKSFDLHWQDLSGVCELSTYLSSVCCFLSGWYVVALSGERCLAVCWPYVSRRICTPRRTTALILILALIGAAVNAPLFYLAKSVPESNGDSTPAIRDRLEVMIVGNRSSGIEISDLVRNVPRIERSADSNGLNQFELDNLPNSQSIHLDRSSDDRVFWSQREQIVESPRSSTVRPKTSRPVKPVPSVQSLGDPMDLISDPPYSPPTIYRCGVDPNSETLYRAFTTMDTVISFSVPLLVTLVLNVAIAYRLCGAARERRALTSSSVVSESRTKLASFSSQRSSTSRRSRHNHNNHDPQSQEVSEDMAKAAPNELSPPKERRSNNRSTFRRNATVSMDKDSVKTRLIRNGRAVARNLVTERRITSVLVAKCVAYLILNLPSYMHRIVLAFEAPVGEEETTQTGQSSSINEETGTSNLMVGNRLLEMVVYLLFYTQFSTNFLLYSLNACVNGAVRLRADPLRKSVGSSRNAYPV